MKTIVGNWKMNVGTRESVALARGVLLALRGKRTLPEVVACPPFVALSEVRKIVARSHVALGAQDVFWEETGAFTGEVSARMLTELGTTHVIVGHSERRAQLGETDETVNKKTLAALAHGLTPIICVGETAAEREAGEAEAVVKRELRTALHHVKLKPKDRLFVAYEPVWAIGSGTPATPADAVAMHRFIKSLLADFLPQQKDGQVGVLYGGSIDGKNAYAFLRENEIDGLLVGGASVKLNEFSDILAAAMDVLEGQLSR